MVLGLAWTFETLNIPNSFQILSLTIYGVSTTPVLEFNIGQLVHIAAAACSAITVFQIYQGTGEWFDLSKKPLERATFAFGGADEVRQGYYVTDKCIDCNLCYSKCPTRCIDTSTKPVVIHQENCGHCSNCLEVCPAGAVIKLG